MPTNVFDNLFPPDTQAANLLGSDIRGFKFDIQERMGAISDVLANRWNPATDLQPLKWTGLLFFATDTNQVFRWSGAAWVDVTGLVGGVGLVATLNLLAQNAATLAVTFYTVPATRAGLYRVSMDILVTTAGTGGVINGSVFWNNGSVNQNSIVATIGANAIVESVPSGNSVGTQVIYVAANQNVQYQVVFNAVTGAPIYNFRARLEYLT